MDSTSKPAPTMLTIAAWNLAVDARSDRLTRIASKRRDRNLSRSFADTGQRPKFAKERTHKHAKPPFHDGHGAYTLTGSVYTMEGCTPTKREHVMAAGVGDGEGFYTARRIWLGGISAQRGY